MTAIVAIKIDETCFVCFLKKIDEKKATGLDRVPSKLLKMAASIIAPSLTSIFSKSILTGIYPNDWKAAKVTPL